MRYVGPLVLLGLVAYLATGIVQVRPGERAVVRRFGRVVDTPGPGLWVGLPWGVDRVDRVPVDRVRRVTVGYQPDVEGDGLTTPPGQFLTGDHNLVNVQAAVLYGVDDTAVVAYVAHADRVDELVARAAEAALAEWAAGRAIDDVLIQGKAVLPAYLVAAVQERLEPYGLGVQVRDADVGHLFPPAEVKQAFDEVTRAQTAVLTRKHEAEQEAARTLADAKTNHYRIERQTEAYVPEKLRLARADAARFELRLEQYRRLRRDNPAFLAGIWWDEVGKLFATLKEGGRLDFLDNHVAGEGLDVTTFPPLPKKK